MDRLTRTWGATKCSARTRVILSLTLNVGPINISEIEHESTA